MMSSRYAAKSGRSPDFDNNLQLFDILAIWCQLAQGAIPLRQGLERIGRLIGSEVTAVSRVDHGRQGDFAKLISHDANTDLSEDAGPFSVSFARGICGAHLETASPGSLWRGAIEDFGSRARLASVFRHRRLAETFVIPLVHQHSSSDLLELHFAHPISAALRHHLEGIGPVLADFWKSRALGVLSEAALSAQRDRQTVAPEGDILSADNPFQLSRAEYRVCLMLSRGLNNKALLEELSIGMATLRTHLRNIYAKTDTASQPELIHRLLSPAAGRVPYRRENRHVA